MPQFTLIDPAASYPLPSSFDFEGYIEIERELWALFPATEGKRVNFVQFGLSAILCSESVNQAELRKDETYMLMPCEDRTLQPVRMEARQRLTLSEYRMAHLTAVKLMGKMRAATEIMIHVGNEMLGDEVLAEVQARL